MILIVSGLLNESGLLWKNSFPKRSAFIVTPLDFSGGGIVVYKDNLKKSRFRSGKKIISLAGITGVLTLVRAFIPEELVQFDKDSKAYAASELNALLTHVLHLLPCKKINAPSFSSFSGPMWSYEHWYRLAIQKQIPCPRYVTRDGQNTSEYQRDLKIIQVDCLNGRVLNPVPTLLQKYAIRLQRASGLNYLSVKFAQNKTGYYFYNAEDIPDGNDSAVRDSIVKYLLHD